MADVEGRFCIDLFEGRLVYNENGSDKDWSPFETPNPKIKYRAVMERNKKPQGYISAAEALKACRNAGKRLCRTDEWVEACQGPNPQRFPYGKKYDPSKCNTERQSAFSMGKVAKNTSSEINQGENSLAPSGSFEACRSGYGVYDMSGNLHEWTSDVWRHSLVEKKNHFTRIDDLNSLSELSHNTSIRGEFRGGYYVKHQENELGCGYRMRGHYLYFSDYSTGFRCCSDPIKQ